MKVTPAEETILKTDGLEQVKTPLARREQLLDELERSGPSRQKFAALVGRQVFEVCDLGIKAAGTRR